MTPGMLWKMIDAFADGIALADSDGTLGAWPAGGWRRCSATSPPN